MQRSFDNDGPFNVLAGAGEPEDPFVSVKAGAVTRRLRLAEIHTIAACENYTQLTLVRERVLVRRRMREWEALLPAGQFARVHRGLFVNLARIDRAERPTGQVAQVHFLGGWPEPIKVKRRHWPALRTKLAAWRAVRPAGLGMSIAVLPFANLSDEPTNEIFCDGVSEELLNVLAKIPGLRVAARTSAFYFKGRNLPIAEIARQLDADFVVEGSVRRSARQVRVTAQLIGASDGFHRWSDTFDRELTDIFALQDEIAGVIAHHLKLKLGGTARGTRAMNPEAHRLTIEGRHFWNLRTSDGFARAEKAFLAALALDPEFAPTHAGLGDLCVVRAMYRLADGAPGAADDLGRARTAAARALALDPGLAEPHATLGFTAFHEGNFGLAADELPQAFGLNPNYATGYQFYAWVLCAQGRLESALDQYARAIRLDPLSFINLDRYAAMLALAGRFAEALEMNERAAALRPDIFVGNLSQRAPLLLALGRCDEAIAMARSVQRVSREVPFRRNSDADAIYVLCETGHAAEADVYGRQILASLATDNYLRGFVLAAVGRHEEAIAALGHPPSIMLPFLYWSRLWEPARRLPAFDELIARLGRNNEYRLARELPVRH